MKLPPLNALRAFEAVARLGSVKQAAGELSVTPAAVSQQLRLLEQHIGHGLFDRLPRELRLTASGHDYHRAIGRHLRGIAEATARVRPKHLGVAISVVPSFATLWVSPRLPLFIRRYPQIEVRLEADPRLVDLPGSQFDLAIREGGGRYRSTEVHSLFPIELLPVASPDYVRTLTRQRRFDWQQARLLFEESTDPWERWFEQRGQHFTSERSVLFSHGMMALAAAAEGEGVALASYCLVESMVRSKRLVVVDPLALPSGDHYWLAWSAESTRVLSEPARLFRDWLIEQAAASTADRAG